MNRQTAHDMLKDAFMDAGLNGKLATHSLRKSFAQRVYEQSGDIYLVQELLGHQNVATTQKYIGVNYATARETVEAMALAAEPYRTGRKSHSISLTTCHTSKSKTQPTRKGYGNNSPTPYASPIPPANNFRERSMANTLHCTGQRKRKPYRNDISVLS